MALQLLALGVFTATSVAAGAEQYDVIVYGSTPSGIIAAVAAARHGAKTAMLSQRAHVGGVCAGGLGQTDIGSCAPEVIGGIPLEFFERNAKSYATRQPRAPWNLEPHVAKQVYLEMMTSSGVAQLPFSEVESVAKTGLRLSSITTVDGATYGAKVFIDASYEGKRRGVRGPHISPDLGNMGFFTA